MYRSHSVWFLPMLVAIYKLLIMNDWGLAIEVGVSCILLWLTWSKICDGMDRWGETGIG